MKKVVVVAASAALLLALAGCSKKESSSASTSTKAASSGASKVELTVWESNLGPDEFIKQAGAKYSQTHAGVTIKYVNVELGDSSSKIALDGPAGFGADLFAAPHDKLGELVNGGHILPTVDPEGVKAEVLGACSKALTYNGKMYGYPISAETYALFYNRAYVSDDEVPTTWEDLKTWVADFNAANPGKRGFVMEVGSGYYTIVFTTLNGNRLFGDSGTDTSSTYLNTPDSVEGMKFFQSFREILNVPAADLQTGICDGAFQAGEAAMCINGPWNLKPFKEAGLDFGVSPLPSLPGESTPSASFSGTRAMFVSSYTDYPEETAEFARYLISDEMQQLRFDITEAMPSIQTEVSSPYIGGFLEQLDYAFPMPSIPQMSAFWEVINSTSSNIWDGADVQNELDACDTSILGS